MEIEIRIANIFTFIHFLIALFIAVAWLGDRQKMEFESQQAAYGLNSSPKLTYVSW